MIAFAIMLFTVMSCSKKDAVVQPVVTTAANAKIKSFSYGSNETLYEYDKTGRLVKAVSNGKLSFMYNYMGDSLILQRFNPDGSVMETIHITFNSAGLMETYLSEQYPNTLIRYEFNADKKLSKQTNYLNGQLNTYREFIYQDGNLLKDIEYNKNGVINNSRAYEYYTDKISTTEFSNTGELHYGTGSKNSLKKTSYINSAGAVYITQDYLVPETDASGRIAKKSYQTNGAGTVTVYNYTYY